MIDMKRVLTVFVVLQAAIIGLLLASRYRITLTPISLPPEPAPRKRAPSKRVLRNGAKLPKTPPRASQNPPDTD